MPDMDLGLPEQSREEAKIDRWQGGVSRFVDEFLRTGSATKAVRVGWPGIVSTRVANRAASLLKSARVLEMIRSRMPQRSELEQLRVYGLLSELQADFYARYKTEPTISNARLVLNATSVLAEACGLMSRISIDASKHIEQTVNTVKIELVDRASLEEAKRLESARMVDLPIGDGDTGVSE